MSAVITCVIWYGELLRLFDKILSYNEDMVWLDGMVWYV